MFDSTSILCTRRQDVNCQLHWKYRIKLFIFYLIFEYSSQALTFISYINSLNRKQSNWKWVCSWPWWVALLKFRAENKKSTCMILLNFSCWHLHLCVVHNLSRIYASSCVQPNTSLAMPHVVDFDIVHYLDQTTQ